MFKLLTLCYPFSNILRHIVYTYLKNVRKDNSPGALNGAILHIAMAYGSRLLTDCRTYAEHIFHVLFSLVF